MDRFDRIFELNRILQAARHPVSRKRLEEELECSRATVKRLIDEMRLFLNAPIVYDRTFNGYRYAQGEGEMYQLPGLWFNASELYALLSMQQLLEQVQPGLLGSHLQPLRRHIEQLLRRQHAGGEQITRRIRILQAAARSAGDHFSNLATAIALRKRLRLDYYSRSLDQSTAREVSPQRLTHYRDNWYLDAWCHLRKGLRTFALDAISESAVLEKKARDINEDELDHHYQSAYGIFSGQSDKTAVLHFTAERARWVAKEQWHPSQESRWLEDGRYELCIPYHNPVELIMDILKYGPDVEVVSPTGLRKSVAGRIAAMTDIYRCRPDQA
ncbi:helix-turn-helix transcriptional regulator [endosymbiont of Lamellibrachia barhami]|uniref:helix-turn-helix transcriptional regulator n=1 Tax=endosymbiont of Lamellibrachia barhami TaxID=205975 RepID=UPI0015B2E778|nr:WYL domain-containing protein [endosymbiont of Lamellibrachia barhami]